MNVLISACLLGVNCRYDGGNSYREAIEQLKDRCHLIPICPEMLGGLAAPRPPAEIFNGKVWDREGKDVSKQFHKGAQETFRIANILDCKYAVLKEKSPSCGSGKIYDGTFTGTLVEGDGITAKALKDMGIQVFGETKIAELLKKEDL